MPSLTAIVPAKGFSERFGGSKNLAEFRGKTLLEHALDSVKFAERRVVLTDCRECVSVALMSKAEPCLMDIDRKWTVLDTVKHWFDQQQDKTEMLGVFLATQLVRTEVEVAAATMCLTGFDGLVSYTDYDFPPNLHLRIQDRLIVPAPEFLRGETRSQDQGKLFRPNGAMYLRWWDSFKRVPNFFDGKVVGWYMKHSFDVDTPEDLERAKRILGSS